MYHPYPEDLVASGAAVAFTLPPWSVSLAKLDRQVSSTMIAIKSKVLHLIIWQSSSSSGAEVYIVRVKKRVLLLHPGAHHFGLLCHTLKMKPSVFCG
jgi:hypothetical protein